LVKLDGDAPQDRTPEVDPSKDPLTPGKSTFNNYSIEVVQRIGYDSYTPDNGVLIAKNKDKESNNGGPNGFNCFNWVIDAHPADIQKVDYLRPGDGTPVMRTQADYRQLNDALFHAGTRSGSLAEWEDQANRLHFYILDKFVNQEGILSYQVGIRSLDGSGKQKRGVTAKFVQKSESIDGMHLLNLRITNTGKSGAKVSADKSLNYDIYRLSISSENQSALLTNELIAIPFGETREVKIYINNVAEGARESTISVRVTSESDPNASTLVRTSK